MSTAGEAASLFGAPDTAHDPFSTALGGEDPLHDSNGDSQTSDAVSDLFGSATEAFPVDGAGSSSSATQPDAQQTWYDHAGQQSYGYNSAATTGYAQPYQPPTAYAQQNGTYPQYGQYDQYAHSNGYSASKFPAHQPAYAQQQSYTSQSYAPYAPSTTGTSTSTYAPATTAQQSPVTQNGTYTPSTSTYAPYKPAQTQSSYEPAARTVKTSGPVQVSYDPYKPAYGAAPAPAPTQTYTYETDSHTPAYGNPPVAVPPPPVPLASAPPPPSPAVAVTQFRPKTSNAYDPPIPPPKVKHAAVPPRVVYNTPPPPLSPPPRTTLTPQSSLVPPPKGPRRTPDPHALLPTRRDSHPPLPPHAPAQQVTPSAYVPPTVNGTSHNTAYQASYHPPTSYGSSHAYGAQPNGSGQFAEGLPRVNDTYAPPSAYVSGLPQQSSPPDIFATSTHEPDHVEHASPISDLGAARFSSPVHQAILEVDEDASRVESYDASQDSQDSPAITSSPPASIGSPVAADSAWSSPGAHPPPTHGPSSPEKTLSLPPPRAPSTAPSASQVPHSMYDPYVPPPKSNAPDRTKSPGASSVHSIASIHKQGYEPPPRRDSVATTASFGRPLSSQSRRSTLSTSYEPQGVDLRRAASPAGSIHSVAAPKQGSYDPYAPSAGPSMTSVHARTISNGSTSSVADPYAPTRHQPIRASSEHTYSSFALPANSYTPSVPTTTTYDRSGAQVVTLATPAHSTVYAPSPSLLGTNDPLGRTSARVPVVSFGFGGKLVICFHGANMSAGFDVALSARQSTDVQIHLLHNVIPESALDSSATSFPGPLYSDPGSPTASLVRTGTQALKSKKAKVVKYLEDRVEEMGAGLGYHRSGTVDRSRAEARRILVLLLKVMVENDGRLSGSAQIDSAVRAALAPQDGPSSSSIDPPKVATGLIPATSAELLSSNYSLSSAIPNTRDQTISNTVVCASQLDKIQDLLAQGDRRGACHYAADEKLWQHALLIASSIDKECWKEVVTEWIRAELVSDSTSAEGDVTNGRESLRVAYSLFGGNGAAAVQELVHPKSLLQHTQNNLQVPQPQLSVTPMTPNFPVIQSLNISQEVLASWAKTAAMILSNPLTPESSAALTALGDQLAVHQWTEAAHACYLLSPQTSQLGGIGSIPKLMLLGSPPPNTAPIYYKDPDHIIFSEILEFALSLATPTKGQEPFAGLHHLQPYRLLRAATLAELGYVQQATRYCEAITACVTRNTPFLNITLAEQLKVLSDRLIAAPQLDKTGSWIGGKMAKPSLDSIGNWLEGRFTKFIAGEGDSPRPEESKGLETQQSFSGPFANYSTISSVSTSAYPSPHQSVTDLTELVTPAAPPFRTGSALANRPPSRSQVPINRASSAMDYARSGGPYGNGYAPSQGNDHLRPEANFHGDVSGLHSKSPSTGSWGWGASESETATPTAASFVNLDDQPSSGTSNSGFISLMDDASLMTPTASRLHHSSATPRASQDDFGDDDDLGLGNSSSKKPATSGNGHASQGTSAPAKEDENLRATEAEKLDAKQQAQAASSGWLTRFWKRADSTVPAPVKANLGDESSFYYDKELKRWVNKHAGGEAPKPSPPPPPPRAQTASPGRQLGNMPPPPRSPIGGPPRPATTHPIDLSSEPPRRPPTRIRSNLVPDDTDGLSAPPSPMPSSGTPPPPGNGPPGGRPRGGAAKRNVRSRYVDVFQQEGSGAS